MRSPFVFLALGAAWLTACSPMRLLDVAVPHTGYEATLDVAYGELERQRLDVYRPVAAPASAPVVLFLYGGRWSDGDKSQYRFVAQALASKGMIAVIPDYRLYPHVRFPAFIRDSAKAVGWTREHITGPGGESSCVYLMGHSAGAHIAAMLTLNEAYLRFEGISLDAICGMVGLAGPYDFLPLTAPDLKSLFAPAGDLRRTQPIHFVDGDEPPLLLMTGTSDTTVRPANAINLARRVRRSGGSARLIRYPNRGHVGILVALAAPARWLAPVLEDIAAFIRGRVTTR